MWAAAIPLIGSLMGSQTDQQESDNILRQQQVLAMGGTQQNDNSIYIILGVFAVLGVVMFFALKK